MYCGEWEPDDSPTRTLPLPPTSHADVRPKMTRAKRRNAPKTTTRKEQVFKSIASPVGRLTLVGSSDGLAAILWETDNPGRARLTLWDG